MGLAATPKPRAQVLRWWVVGRGVEGDLHCPPSRSLSWDKKLPVTLVQSPTLFSVYPVFILISDLKRVAQHGTFPQSLLASGTKYFLKNKNFCAETFWLMPQGVPMWGHTMVCTTRCPWKTNCYFQHFKVSKTRRPSCRRSIYLGEGFSSKDIHLGACHHFVKQIC